MAKKVRYKDLGDSLLLKVFGYTPKLRITDILMTNPYFDFSKNELVKELGMSKQTLYKNFGDLGNRCGKGFKKDPESCSLQDKHAASARKTALQHGDSNIAKNSRGRDAEDEATCQGKNLRPFAHMQGVGTGDTD